LALRYCLFWMWESFIFKIEQGKVEVLQGLAVVIPTPTSSMGDPFSSELLLVF
jgi:hypothetical protein